MASVFSGTLGWELTILANIVILVVGFRNAPEVINCLRALAVAQSEPTFEVFIAENGGPSGMDALIDALAAEDSPCRKLRDSESPTHLPGGVRRHDYRLVRTDTSHPVFVHVVEMTDNLGYAGAVNFWLRRLLEIPGWESAWILNPDTTPTPSALAELVAYSKRRGKMMVGSRLVQTADADHAHSRGLAWQKLAAKTLAIDYQAPTTPDPDMDDVEARLTAPSGASCYVTRSLIERIGLMDERYFLYFEDLEWGDRAKRLGMVGYAHHSIVPHQGGTTIGTATSRAALSRLAVYLEIRNRILFVRDRYPRWLLWTVLMQVVHATAFGAVGAFGNMVAGYKGLVAGIRGETGRPDRMLSAHLR